MNAFDIEERISLPPPRSKNTFLGHEEEEEEEEMQLVKLVQMEVETLFDSSHQSFIEMQRRQTC